MANTIKFQEEWATTLQDRLKKPTNWKEVADVIYSDSQVFELPYVGTASESALQTGLTRGNTYTFQDITISTETLTIGTYDIIPEVIDRADEAQSRYAKRMERARIQGDKINERLEAITLATATSGVDLGDDGSGGWATGTATPLAITATNVDNLSRAVVREIQKANGFTQFQRDGGFIVHTPASWEAMTEFMQANGFSFADAALMGASPMIGKKALDLYHYVSTSHTANHILAGVRKTLKLGILSSTYGQVYIIDDPAGASGGNISGIGVNSRLDYGTKLPSVASVLWFDVNHA